MTLYPQKVHQKLDGFDKRLEGHFSQVIRFTRLSGPGKSTIADALEMALHERGIRTYVVDGDNVRLDLNSDLGFTDADRVENIRRIGEVAKLMVVASILVITAFISPFQAERDFVRGLFDEGEFFEIFVDTPLEVAELRDPKGLYQKVRRGESPNFTGIGSPYEPPIKPELRIETLKRSVEDAVEDILEVSKFEKIS